MSLRDTLFLVSLRIILPFSRIYPWQLRGPIRFCRDSDRFSGPARLGSRFARVARNFSSLRPSSSFPPRPFCTFFVSHSRFTYRTGNEISCPVLNLVTVMYCPSSNGSSWKMIKRNKLVPHEKPCDALKAHAIEKPTYRYYNAICNAAIGRGATWFIKIARKFYLLISVTCSKL